MSNELFVSENFTNNIFWEIGLGFHGRRFA